MLRVTCPSDSLDKALMIVTQVGGVVKLVFVILKPLAIGIELIVMLMGGLSP